MAICVIGAGIVGLSCAIQLQLRFRDSIRITIIADKFNEETLSSGAGGIFGVSSNTTGPRPDSITKWGKISYKYYSSLMRSDEAGIAGIQEVSGYYLKTDSSRQEKEKLEEIDMVLETAWMEFLREFHSNVRAVTDTELQGFPGNWAGGIFFTTMIIDGIRYLPFLTDKFIKNGGQIVKQTITNFEELIGNYDVVVNCGGLRAAQFVNDSKVVPMRGQIIRVRAPWIKHFYYGDSDTYILPSTDTVALGGTRQYNSYNTKIDRRDSEGIWERCCDIVPSLKDATVVKEWVGLRPHRDPIRLEAERLEIDGKYLNVVHNYGHGGTGVTLSWGSASEAVELVTALLASKIPDSKL